MDTPNKPPVEVIDTVGQLVRENRALKLKVQFLTEDVERLRKGAPPNANADIAAKLDNVAEVIEAADLLGELAVRLSVLKKAVEWSE